MTPYEMLDLAQSSYATSAAYISIFIALLSAFLVAAYIVGNRLSKMQFLLANILYCTIQSITILTIYNFNTSANYWVHVMRSEALGSSETSNFAYFPETVAVVCVITVVLSVWFMWQSWAVKDD